MKSVTLGALEQQVMDIVWDNKTMHARDVQSKLLAKKKLAYTTVTTILQRLYDKGLVNRKKDKSGYIYTPKLSKAAYSKTIAKSFLNKFISSFGDTAIASFADSIETLPEQKRKYFISLLEDHEKNKQ
jgi:predicted transcriptional regulator